MAAAAEKEVAMAAMAEIASDWLMGLPLLNYAGERCQLPNCIEGISICFFSVYSYFGQKDVAATHPSTHNQQPAKSNKNNRPDPLADMYMFGKLPLYTDHLFRNCVFRGRRMHP